MKFPGLGMSKSMKQTFLGGIAGSLTYFMEEAAYELVPNYPVELKNRIDANLPRNGQLLAVTAPLAAAWVAPKIIKRHTETVNNIKMGVTLYDLPKLVQQIVVNVAYNAGKPKTGFTFPMNRFIPSPTVVAARNNGFVVAATSGAGKYAAVTASPTVSSGIGKYAGA